MAEELELERLKSNRKRRLFGCACVREIWHLLNDDRSRRAVEVSEAFANGWATEEELNAACGAASDATESEKAAEYAAWGAVSEPAGDACWGAAQDAAGDAAWDTILATDKDAALAIASNAARAAASAARQKQTLLLEDVAGPDPLPTLPRTELVVNLAQAIYDDWAFDRLPILADALEEAGCTNAEILTHCRGPGPHVRGCWVLDLLLGKT